MDAYLRDAERSDDLLRVLAARLRAGLITREQLALAAYCGSEAARSLGPFQYDAGNATWNFQYFDQASLVRWFGHLESWGLEPRVRATIAAALEALPAWELRQDWIHGERANWSPGRGPVPITATEAARPRNCIGFAKAWLDRQNRARAEAARAAGNRLGELRLFSDAPWLAITGDWDQAVCAVVEGPRSAVGLVGEVTVRTVVRKALTRWTLGTP